MTDRELPFLPSDENDAAWTVADGMWPEATSGMNSTPPNDTDADFDRCSDRWSWPPTHAWAQNRAPMSAARRHGRWCHGRRSRNGRSIDRRGGRRRGLLGRRHRSDVGRSGLQLLRAERPAKTARLPRSSVRTEHADAI